MFGARTPLDAGLDAFSKRNWKRARAHLEDAAMSGERQAEFHLGLLCWRGLGGPQDREGAVYWFRRAADAELPAAQDALAVALRSGAGCERDPEEARRLFMLAAERGYAPAMGNLATMCPPQEAQVWMTRAAESGHAPSMLHLSDFLERRDPVEALAWLYSAAAFAGEDAAAQRAKALARELSAPAIAAAQKRGRDIVKQLNAERKLQAT